MKKRYVLTIAAIMLCLTMLLSACDALGALGGGSDDTPAQDENLTLGSTFEFDGLEITLSNRVGYTRVRDRWSDNDGEYVFYIPVTVTNISDGSNGLDPWGITVFSPAGTSIDFVPSWYSQFEDTNIFSVGNVQPNVTKEGNIYIYYGGDGEYIIEFEGFVIDDDSFEMINVEVKFEITFDFSGLPEIQTEFSLGETLNIGGMEITIADDISWGIIQDTWSDHEGEYYFFLPVALHNASNEAQGFPWSFDIFGPDGTTVDSIAWVVDADDISRSDDILPGARYSGYLHVLFVGDGVYTLQFMDPEFRDELRVLVPITFDPDTAPVIYVPQTEFILGEVMVVDDLEITFSDDFDWGTVDARWSDLHGEVVFVIPVTVTNIGTSANSFPWSVTAFGPNGLELANPRIDGDIMRSGDILPGATLEGILHVLFDGYGDYVIRISASWREEVYLLFTIVGDDAATTTADDDDEDEEDDED